jgi:drug/metabolite transporter (DMT)-like permease
LEILALVLIILGFVLSFKLKGQAARQARKWFVIGLALALGGCLGSLSWLNAETSGNSSFANSINPFFWAGLFVVGVLVLFVNSLQVIKTRADQKYQSVIRDEAQDDEGSREF